MLLDHKLFSACSLNHGKEVLAVLLDVPHVVRVWLSVHGSTAHNCCWREDATQIALPEAKQKNPSFSVLQHTFSALGMCSPALR
jgi:hypothetical protein